VSKPMIDDNFIVMRNWAIAFGIIRTKAAHDCTVWLR